MAKFKGVKDEQFPQNLLVGMYANGPSFQFPVGYTLTKEQVAIAKKDLKE